MSPSPANDVIYEVVLTTRSALGALHIAPMGVRYRREAGVDQVVVMPFKPSTTLDNIRARRGAVLNVVTDTRVFAGCVTGRRDWACEPVPANDGLRLACGLRHLALELVDDHDDVQRPVLTLRVTEQVEHAPFLGFNRAQAAVIEGAVLISRLKLLPLARIERELAPLQVAIDKTASACEHEAWGWLLEAVERHRQTLTPTEAAAPEGR
ncbi:DUF447 domain-containing protein [Sphaerotilus mobilis]|uniref:DUF447 family protein n=1 Tax=Sphaerotilus mobilis TaxID=47994 RepID=A0A4Q7LDQ6_9BURK|nr:DUF447 domain-containing protein [Sphaerotilus mobilis]RZS52194.1 hypothetical protein EV685_3385 [Sphaerotilus mobilis]